MIKSGRKIAIIALPSITAISGILLNLFEYQWIDWIFKISLSGTVGIGTNYIAIKMLFRPRKRTPLGRQGLIPKRRDDIAEGIATAVSGQLLDTDSILRYLEDNDLIEKAASGLLVFTHGLLENPQNRSKIINAVGRYVQNRGVEQAERFFSKVAELIKNHASENLSSDKVWSHARSAIEREIEKPETLHLLTMLVTDLAEKNASTIADAVNGILEDWINSKSFLAKKAMMLGKGVFRIDSSRIREELLKKVRSPSFFQNVMDLIGDNIASISSIGDDPAVKKRFSLFFDEQKQRFDHWLKTEGVASAREKLITYLESESFWNWLEKQLDGAVGKLESMAEKKIQSEEFRKTARNFMLQYAHRIDIREMVRKKVSEFELQQLEELITDVSGESLAGIELFGGILGMLAGLILINQWFVVILMASTGIFWLTERLLTEKRKGRRMAKKNANESRRKALEKNPPQMWREDLDDRPDPGKERRAWDKETDATRVPKEEKKTSKKSD
ncbi:MAG: DUF445 domain-containing protein [Candidatus Sabulitectum sp.]|nr:DUF445 domain-containing protein [Candidatus Sabulitectum sp.]